MTLVIITTLFETKKYSSQCQQTMHEMKINFETDTELPSCRKKLNKTTLVIFKSLKQASDTKPTKQVAILMTTEIKRMKIY